MTLAVKCSPWKISVCTIKLLKFTSAYFYGLEISVWTSLHPRTTATVEIGRTSSGIDWYPKRILINRIWRRGEGRLVQSHKKRGWVIHNAILSVKYFYWFRSNGTYLFLIPKTFMVSSYRRLLESSLTCKLGKLFEHHEINCILSLC